MDVNSGLRIGLSGAHRTGKTTLAKRLAEHLEIPYLDAEVSKVFRRMKVKPTTKLTFEQRLEIQHLVLEQYIAKMATTPSFVTDRTPLDFMAYALAEYSSEVAKSVSYDVSCRLSNYIETCFDTLDATIDANIIVCPGIEVEEDDSKACCDLAFIDKMHCLIAGLAYCGKIDQTTIAALHPEILNLEDRVLSCVELLKMTGFDVYQKCSVGTFSLH